MTSVKALRVLPVLFYREPTGCKEARCRCVPQMRQDPPGSDRMTAVSSALDRLERQGLVRRRSEQDRGVVAIEFTEL